MRKNCLIISIVCFAICIFTLSYAETTYKAKTVDDTVTELSGVSVSVIGETGEYTLAQVDSLIEALQSEIIAIQNRISNLQAIRVSVETEAKKVKLKAKVVEPVVEEPK